MRGFSNTAVHSRLPEWFKNSLPTDVSYRQTKSIIGGLKLHTVCESAHCPNQWECWSKRTATFMIAGDRCTRACAFCAVNSAKPLPIDTNEPQKIAEAAQKMNLKHIVITSVARDDLQDGGAEHFRQTIQTVRKLNPGCSIEVLVPDFKGSQSSIATVLSAEPDIFNHNIETVKRLTSIVRCKATYKRSLNVLFTAKKIANKKIHTKSGLMVGLGETEEEVIETMKDLRNVDCDILTIGQYLQPGPKYFDVAEYIKPEQFEKYAEIGRNLGFLNVFSSPKVRSSYHAAEVVT
ncbi:MAG TPA: lipoyl synthase, partial [Verrucomicrobiota bacterium]|nr:lipoyl synthase [Verrucomicrobiota bacterium]